MVFRVLSGILSTRGHKWGKVQIHFREHKITGTINKAIETQEMGPVREFRNPPCKIISLRELKVKADMTFLSDSDIDFFKIDDTLISNDCLEIEWNATGGSEIEEIAYLIMGEV